MRMKVTFLTGFAAGYLLGAKAGRRRYEQIMQQVNSFLGKPEVKQTVDAVKQEAEEIIDVAKKVATDTFAGKDVTNKNDSTKTGAYGNV